ncbi:MAG: efflux RND transporter periplasmic adaptor subunit [Acidobacteria bacterium]|nr:efflux RND transporter periplasmic adaptor subunit [Acidobacteriota bacterium]
MCRGGGGAQSRTRYLRHIAAIRVDFGSRVRKGDVIAELDKQEYQIALDRTNASLAQALARIGLSSAQANVTPESTPAMRQANAQLEDAKFKYESAAKLVKSGDIARERFNEIEKGYAARTAAWEATRDDLRMHLATIQALQAEVRMATKRFNDTVVRAPFDGAVSARTASPGQYMKENTPIVTLVKTWPLRLRAEIPESATGATRTGTSLTFTTDSAPGVEFHAVIKDLNPSLDPKARSLTAEARLVENDSRLRPGGFVQVKLVTSRDAGITTVPKQALYSVAGLSKVFVVRDGKILEFRVPPGLETDGWVEVPGEIRPGDSVVINKLDLLVDGAPVRTVKG